MTNNAAADAAAYDDELNRRGFNDAAEQDPPQCECCGHSYGVEWLRKLERLACEACALAYAVALDEVAATGASREESSMDTATKMVMSRARAFKRDAPGLSDAEVCLAMMGLGYPGDLVTKALNAIAAEARL